MNTTTKEPVTEPALDDLVAMLNLMLWPVAFRKLLLEKRMTAAEYLFLRMAPPPQKAAPTSSLRKLIEQMTQREVCEELLQLATPERLSQLQLERHREIAAGAAKQYANAEMNEATRGLANSALRNLRKIADKERR